MYLNSNHICILNVSNSDGYKIYLDFKCMSTDSKSIETVLYIFVPWKFRLVNWEKKGYGIPELRIMTPKTELSQNMTSQLIFRNSKFLMKTKFPNYVTRKF